MVALTLTGESSVSQVARNHDVNANQLFKWRKLYRDGKLGTIDQQTSQDGLLPVVTQPAPCSPATPDSGGFDIDLGNGRQVSIRGAVDPLALRTVLEVLK